MGSKSKERVVRKAQKQKKLEEANKKLRDKVHCTDEPKYIVSVSNTMMLPQIGQNIFPNITNLPKATKDGANFGKLVTWCITKADRDGQWSWHEHRQWTDNEWITDIEPTFKDFASKTWAQIDALSSGSGHKMHHSQDISTLIKEARRRWQELGLDEFDTAFRFRLGGKKRVWGFIVGVHFFFVWWERYHKLYPVKNK